MRTRSILLVVSINRGGGFTTALALAEEWGNRVDTVQLLCLSVDDTWHGPEIAEEKYHLRVPLAGPASSTLRAIHSFGLVLREIRSNQVDTVVAFGDYSGIIARYAIAANQILRRETTTLMVREAQPVDFVDVLKAVQPSVGRTVFLSLARFAYFLGWISIAATEQRREELEEKRQSARSRYEVVPNPIAISPSAPEHIIARAARIRDFGRGQPLVLVYVGDFNRGKNIASLIHALAMLPAQVKLKLVGDGEELNNLREIAYLVARNRVTFVPVVRDVEPELRSSDIFVSPSLNESFGNAMAEAIMCGLPLVTTPSGPGVQEFTNRYEYVFISEDSDPMSLARSIQTAVRQDYCPATIIADAVAARERHRVGSVAADYLRILNS